MSNIARMMQRATAGAAGAGLDVDEVFSTHLYDGNSGTQTITNGIDLSGEGGLVWIKRRDGTLSHALFDTERGVGKLLQSDLSNSEYGTNTPGDDLTNFNSNGFTLGDGQFTSINYSSYDYVSWTFRKAPKFFDVVKYDGSSSAQTIAHNLGVTPAVMIVKQLNSSGRWTVYHKDASPTGNPENGRLALNTTDQWYEYPSISSFANLWNQTAPTSTHFTVGTDATTGASGSTYVAYLFAHNNSDGEFGPDADQDIIKCGSFTSDGTDTITLGFEPQWLMVKQTNGSAGWYIWDTMRGWQVGDVGNNNDPYIYANSSNAESDFTVDVGFPTATGFETKSFGVGDYIYMAIRRGPLAEPTSATDVFAIDNAGGGPPTFTSGFPVDMSIYRDVGGSDWNLFDRLRGDAKELNTNSTNAESSNAGTYYNQDLMTGIGTNTGTATDAYQWMWKRAPGYFDVVAYTGNYTDGRTITHNLGVAPEMIWVKLRDTYSAEWMVFHKDLATNHNLQLDSTAASADYSGRIRSPTATTFTVGNDTSVNRQSPLQYIAYLFATVAGVSKVGSVSHTSGSGTNVDCGFSNGARFIILKRYDAVSDWWVFDTVRGIAVGNDDRLILNKTNAETSTDQIDPYSAGFTIDSNRATGDYIFYAIA